MELKENCRISWKLCCLLDADFAVKGKTIDQLLNIVSSEMSQYSSVVVSFPQICVSEEVFSCSSLQSGSTNL